MNKLMLVAESAIALPERQTMGRFVVIDSHLGSNHSYVQANTASVAVVAGKLNIDNEQIVGNGSGAYVSVSQS